MMTFYLVRLTTNFLCVWQVLLLEKRVCELETDSSESEEQIARLRQENLTLVHRANALEEQLKEQELRSEENTLALTRKHRDALNKLQRERDLEIENLQARSVWRHHYTYP